MLRRYTPLLGAHSTPDTPTSGNFGRSLGYVGLSNRFGDIAAVQKNPTVRKLDLRLLSQLLKAMHVIEIDPET
jgi:hypothetical protein